LALASAISEIYVNTVWNGSTNTYRNNGPASWWNFNNQSSGGWAFNIAPSGTAGNAISFTQAMTLDASGYFMVNTTSVFARQTIGHNGASDFGLAVVNTAGGTAGQTSIRFMRNGADVGSITTTNTATSYNTSSDYRLKEDIVPMTGALAKVAALKPCTYKWKSDGSDGEGFIAHELAEVVPGCVTGEKDAVNADGNPKYQGIDTSFLVATLTAALQEAHGLIKDQAAAIQTLTARVTALEGTQP
jgi:hypothetical protein